MAASSAGRSTSFYAVEEKQFRFDMHEIELRKELQEQINRYPVTEHCTRCFHSTDMKAAFEILAHGLQPSELFNGQLNRLNHSAGVFFTKLSPLEFGFPARGWRRRLLYNNYGMRVVANQPENEWVMERAEVCLVVDLLTSDLRDAAEESKGYKREGRNVFYVPKEKLAYHDRKYILPRHIVFAFRTTLNKEPTAADTEKIRPRWEAAMKRDCFEAEWLVDLAFDWKQAAGMLNDMWSEQCQNAAGILQQRWQVLDRRQEFAITGRLQELRDETCAMKTLMKVLTPRSLLKLEFSSAGVTASGAAVLAAALVDNRWLQTLILLRNFVGDEGASKLGDALKDNHALRCLKLTFDTIGHEGVAGLGEGLKRNSTLEELSLKGNRIGCLGAAALGQALDEVPDEEHSNRALRELDLSETNIGRHGAIALGDSLQFNRSLQVLTMETCDMGPEVTDGLRKALQCNNALQELDLTKNSIGAEGAGALSKALTLNSNCQLELLDLTGNDIGDEGAAALAEALAVNCSLRILGLSYNSIEKAGAEELARGVARNKTLEDLYLDGNSIGDDGAVALASALQFNRTLKTLEVGSNGIGDKGEAALGEAEEMIREVTCHRRYSLFDWGAPG